MPLNTHKRKHLNAIKNWVARVRLKPIPVQKRQAAAKGVPWNKWTRYLNKLENRVQTILDSRTWPNVTNEDGTANVEPSEIHDFLKKRSSSIRE